MWAGQDGAGVYRPECTDVPWPGHGGPDKESYRWQQQPDVRPGSGEEPGIHGSNCSAKVIWPFGNQRPASTAGWAQCGGRAFILPSCSESGAVCPEKGDVRKVGAVAATVTCQKQCQMGTGKSWWPQSGIPLRNPRCVALLPNTAKFCDGLPSWDTKQRMPFIEAK